MGRGGGGQGTASGVSRAFCLLCLWIQEPSCPSGLCPQEGRMSPEMQGSPQHSVGLRRGCRRPRGRQGVQQDPGWWGGDLGESTGDENGENNEEGPL